MSLNLTWYETQVRAYREVRPRYQTCAEVVEAVLTSALQRLAPLSIVQCRAKSVPSFAEKALRKRSKYVDPVHQLTDLCAARAIVHTKADVASVSGFVRECFEIDESNSIDAVERLRASEFGYRSVHYVARFKPDVFPNELAGVEIPDELYGLAVEIQVRTIAQHAWAEVGHDRLYKSEFPIPDRWIRRAAAIAALLESVDDAFSSLIAEVDTYRLVSTTYADKDQLHQELDILKAVYRYDPENEDLAHRIADLAGQLEQWAEVVAFLNQFPGEKSARLLDLLGFAYCQMNQHSRDSESFLRGRELLKQAGDADPSNLSAIINLADTWIGSDDLQALKCYETAFSKDPTNPRALSGYTSLKIAHEKSLGFVSLLAPSLRTAAKKCTDQALLGVNLPWALFHLGEFRLLLGQYYDSLESYTHGIAASPSEYMIDAALKSVRNLRAVQGSLPEVDWVINLLSVAKSAKFASSAGDTLLAERASRSPAPIQSPVVIVTGGCAASAHDQMRGYRDLLVAAFERFSGTVISGGTTAGISGVVGDLVAHCGGQFQAIGYVPKELPDGVVIDRRYHEIRETDAARFSALEPLQYWIDLLASGVRPSQVRVVGIGGGQIAAFEYRLAHALGATVGVLRNSGREADRLLAEVRDKPSAGIIALPADPWTLRMFFQGPGDRLFDPADRERLAQTIHAKYADERNAQIVAKDAAMADWDALDPGLKESNYRQAADIERKLAALGLKAVRVADRDIQLRSFAPDEIEILAEMEHGRWNAERLIAGWTLGERNVERKQSPYLVSWSDLPEEIKHWDRQAVAHIPELLKTIGLEIQTARAS